jgi:hypothetical protein
MNSSEETRSLFSKWRQEQAKFDVIYKGPSLGFGFRCLVAKISDKGVVSLAEREPTPESPASILVQFRLAEIASFVSDDLGKFNLSEEMRFMVKSSVAGSWIFTFKNGERLVMHKQVSAA